MAFNEANHKLTFPENKNPLREVYQKSSSSDHFTDLPFINNIDLKVTNDVDLPNKFNNSWVSLDNLDNMYSKNKGETDKVNCLANRKSDFDEKDLAKLGYVIPEEKTLFSNPASNKSNSSVDVDDSSLVFVADKDFSPRDNEILVVNIDGSQLHSLDLNKVTTDASSNLNINNGINSSDSFCDLGYYDSSEFECGDKNKGVFSPCESNVLHSYAYLASPRYLQFENNSPLFYLENNHLPHHPEYSLLNDATETSIAPLKCTINSMSQRKSSQLPYSGAGDEPTPVPKPPPELGLPDLTKKHLFPACPVELSTGAPVSEADATVLVKNKVMGIWNNVKYGRRYQACFLHIDTFKKHCQIFFLFYFQSLRARVL